MASAIFIGLTISLTITAFFLPQGIGKGMLSMVGIIFWLITGFLLYNMTWITGNTYFPYAVIIGCLSMVIIMIVYTLNIFIFSLQDHTPALTDEQEQQAYKQQIYKLTKKKDKAPW